MCRGLCPRTATAGAYLISPDWSHTIKFHASTLIPRRHVTRRTTMMLILTRRLVVAPAAAVLPQRPEPIPPIADSIIPAPLPPLSAVRLTMRQRHWKNGSSVRCLLQDELVPGRRGTESLTGSQQ